MQTDLELTLDKAKKKICQKEAVHQQQDILKGRDTHLASELEAIKYKSKYTSGTKKNDSTPPTPKKCTRCGKAKYPCDKYPARDAECFKCHKKGHYSSLCLSTVLSTEQTNTLEAENEDNFLGTVESQKQTHGKHCGCYL